MDASGKEGRTHMVQPLAAPLRNERGEDQDATFVADEDLGRKPIPSFMEAFLGPLPDQAPSTDIDGGQPASENALRHEGEALQNHEGAGPDARQQGGGNQSSRLPTSTSLIFKPSTFIAQSVVNRACGVVNTKGFLLMVVLFLLRYRTFSNISKKLALLGSLGVALIVRSSSIFLLDI